MMKKMTFGLLAVILLFGVIAVCAVLLEKDAPVDVLPDDPENIQTDVPTEMLNAMGSEMRESIAVIMKTIQRGDGAKAEIAGTIAGEPVLAAVVEMRAISHRYAGSETPLEDAWDSLKMQAFEREFAEEHGLLPTEDEIVQFTQEMRKNMESDESGILYEETLLNAMGMTPDYYWDVFKPKMESPAHLIGIHIADYCDENGVSWEDIIASMNVEAELTNQRLIEKYSGIEGKGTVE